MLRGCRRARQWCRLPSIRRRCKSDVTEIQEIGERLVELPSIEIGQTGVAKYTARRRGPPSQGWTTFLRNHADGIAAMDIFVVRTTRSDCSLDC